MSLVRLVYTSRFSQSVTTKDLQDILERSRSKNPSLGITGALSYSPGWFLQALEGPRKPINELYAKIVGDKRNLDVTLLDYSEVEKRSFPKWAMAYVPADSVSGSVASRFFPSNALDPFEMTAAQAMDFLTYMVKNKD